MSIKQATLDGDTTDATPDKPRTLLYCEQCDENILRSRRYDHPHELEPHSDYLLRKAKEKVPEEWHAATTGRYRVEFHYEMVETVWVEAANRSDAKRVAEDERDYNGEITHTVHTDTLKYGESPVSVEYLETMGWLADDHDLTQDDIDRICEAAGDE